MHFQVVTVAHSLERPQEELGDVTLSPVFRRVSARCPVLHLFGYVHVPLPDAAMPRPPHQRYIQRRACLHVHGVYPSLLLPQYDRGVSAEQLAAQLETVVMRVLSRQGMVIPNQQLVHDVRIVHRYNVYGYRPHAYAFYLVELIDPAMQQHVMDVLQNTREVGGRQWQLYDAHMKYHTQFMVHWRINGVAPFPLPVSRCHVRLPTAVELHPYHHHHNHRCHGDSSTSASQGTQKLNKNSSESTTYITSEAVTSRKPSRGSAGSSVPSLHDTGLPFLRFWRSDELGRLTTAEVEMDICARDLGEPAESADAAADERNTNGCIDYEKAPACRTSVSAGDNLSYTRRIIRQYFKEHGVPDALRVADTIAMERHLQAEASSALVSAADKDGAAAALTSLLRYGSVVQVQRADPAVRWMRHRMLEYLEQRRACAPSAATAVAVPAAAAAQDSTSFTKPQSSLQPPTSWKTESDGGDENKNVHQGEHGSSPASPSSSRLTAAGTAASAALPSTVPFTDVGPARPMIAAVQQQQQEQEQQEQQEQRVIRARMVAQYRRPGGGHRHCRFARKTTVQTASEGHVAVPALLPTYAELGAGAAMTTGGRVANPPGYTMSSDRASGDAVYIGFSSDSLQPSPSQDNATPSSATGSAPQGEGGKGAEDTAVVAAAAGFRMPSQSWLHGIPVDSVREAEMAATQDLMAALVARSSTSIATVAERDDDDAVKCQVALTQRQSTQQGVVLAIAEDAGSKSEEESGDDRTGVDDALSAHPSSDCAKPFSSGTAEAEEVDASRAMREISTKDGANTSAAHQRNAAALVADHSSWSLWSSDFSPSSSDKVDSASAKVTKTSRRRRGKEKKALRSPLKSTMPQKTLSRKKATLWHAEPLLTQPTGTNTASLHNMEGEEDAQQWHDGLTQRLQQQQQQQQPQPQPAPLAQRLPDRVNPPETRSFAHTVADDAPIVSSVKAAEEDNGCAPLFSSTSSSGVASEVDNTCASRKVSDNDGDVGSGHDALRFSLQTPHAHTTASHAVGDCIAFVCVRKLSRLQPPASPAPASPVLHGATLCEVLAVARIARLDGDTADLQWLLTLGETHLAGDEAALVRRGAWVRLSRMMGVSLRSDSSNVENARGSVERPARLGEMLLGDVVDTVPASVLLADEAPPSALVYAAAHSAPTQRLPEDCDDTTRGSPDDWHRRPTPPSFSSLENARNEDPYQEAVVRVWSVQCCADMKVYEGGEGCKVREGEEHHYNQQQQQQRSRPGSVYPQLRILCRYQYMVEARVLTALPHDSFTTNSIRDEDGTRRNPRCYSCETGRLNFAAAVGARHDLSGADQYADVMQSHTRSSDVAEVQMPPPSLSRSPRHSSSSSTRQRSTRVLFTQPEKLSLSDIEGDDNTARAAPFRVARRPFLKSAQHDSTIDVDKVSDLRQAATALESTGAGEDTDSEDIPLFPSSLSDRSSSSSSNVEGDSEAGPHQPLYKKQRRQAERVEPAGGFKKSNGRHLQRYFDAFSSSSSPRRRARVDAPLFLSSNSTREGELHFRLSTLLMPVRHLHVGPVDVQRRVWSATHRAEEERQNHEQLRWRYHPAARMSEPAARSQHASKRQNVGCESVMGGLPGPTASLFSSEASLFNEEKEEEAEEKKMSLVESTEPPSADLGNASPKSQQNEKAATRSQESDVGRVAEDEALIKSIPLLSSVPLHHTVPDTPSSAAAAASASASSFSMSQASSVEAVGVVTASQRHFLNAFHDHKEEGQQDRATRVAALLESSSMGPAVDGVPRYFCVTASADGDFTGKKEGGEEAPRMFSGRKVRMQVSAVTWPYVARTATVGGEKEEQASAPQQRLHYEHMGISSVDTVSSTTPRSPTATPNAATFHAKATVARAQQSTSHVPGLSLSVAQQPQHCMQCVLRVQYVEVLLNRRPGETLVSTSSVLAVALGQATTAANGSLGVRIFSVASTQSATETMEKEVKGEEGERQGGADETTTTTAKEHTATAMPLPELRLHGLCSPVQVVTLADEAALLTRVREEIVAYDPDVLLSWEGYKYGLGYLALRYRAVLQRSLAGDLSRMLVHRGYTLKSMAPPAPELTCVVGNCKAQMSGTNTNSGGAAAAASNEADQPHVQVDKSELGAAAGLISGDLSSTRPPSPPPRPNVQHIGSSSDSCASSTVLSDFEQEVVVDDDDSGDSDGDGDATGGQASFRAANACGSAARLAPGRRGRGGWNNNLQQQQQRRYGMSHADAGAAATMSESAAAAAASYSKRFGANVFVTGRICTSLGKNLRKDVKMPSYALPMVHAELFGQPLPYFTDTLLADLFHSSADPGEREAALRYLAARVAAPHRIASALHWFTRLLEFSRMYGILAEEVVTRGSQYRVEATLLRLAHPLKYAMLSPSMLQVHRQPRIECVPLVMQPKADFYGKEDPVVVLDFRSLYPSIIIAYNLCYTTCLGMVQPTAHGRLGVVANFTQRDSLLAELLPDDGAQHDSVVFTPNGAMFVAPSTRVGLLPQMVQAVLDTRFEVQASLKHIAIPTGDDAMQQRLQEQQLALKMLANVTYGYTAASFTGRMPCVDLAEAIVSLGRQTLERAAALIHSTPAWKAEVVYGDTDSLFVLLRGRSLPEAFAIGQQMADAVTQSNPSPIRLQFEKVLSPCLLLVKKRYAGYAWTAPTQTTPTFLAKGIEVVRRDQCLATSQLTRRMLQLLFDGCTAATLRQIYYGEIAKLQTGTVNPLRCIFRRAVKLGRYGRSGDGHLPLAARLALKRMEQDVTETPYWGERLPYVVVRSIHSIDNLTDQVLHPAHLLYLHDTHCLDASYYITRNINSSLDRVFYLVGISFAQWYQAMPRRRKAHAALLNLPTFMKAQEQLKSVAAGRGGRGGYRPPSFPSPSLAAFSSHLASAVTTTLTTASRTTEPRHVQEKSSTRRERLAVSDSQCVLNRVAQLTRRMKHLLRESTDPLFAHRRDARLLSTMEVISDSDGEGANGDDKQTTRREGDGERARKGSALLALPASSSPVDVEELTQPTVQEFVDVEQTMATQRVRLATSSGLGNKNGSDTANNTTSSPNPQLLQPRGLFPQRFPVRRRRGGGGGVTLDTFYPRTLCVVCEKESVSLDDVRRQRELLEHVHRVPGSDAPHAYVLDESLFVRERSGTQRVTDKETASLEAGATPTSSAPSPLLLPPVCTRCWSDPLTLYLHVQERCRVFGRQLHILESICACCIGSGGDWDTSAQSLYTSAVLDMEDMDVFCSVRATTTQDGMAALAPAVGCVPRHLVTAVELSPEGVPRGCVSIDCAVSFEKKWMAEQWQQWQAIQRFLRSVL